MTISRRRFLAGIGIGAAASAAPATWINVVAPALGLRPRRQLDLAEVDAETVRPHVGSRFRLDRPGGPAIDLELAEVISEPVDRGGIDSFSLRFTAAQPLDLPQSAFPLEHAVLGQFGIFLVPTGGSATAVINHVARR